MKNRVEVDPLVIEMVNEMKEKYKIKTNKELVEKCIIFCSQNNVIFNDSKEKTFTDVYFKLNKLEKAIENLPLSILNVINSEL